MAAIDEALSSLVERGSKHFAEHIEPAIQSARGTNGDSDVSSVGRLFWTLYSELIMGICRDACGGQLDVFSQRVLDYAFDELIEAFLDFSFDPCSAGAINREASELPLQVFDTRYPVPALQLRPEFSQSGSPTAVDTSTDMERIEALIGHLQHHGVSSPRIECRLLALAILHERADCIVSVVRAARLEPRIFPKRSTKFYGPKGAAKAIAQVIHLGTSPRIERGAHYFWLLLLLGLAGVGAGTGETGIAVVASLIFIKSTMDWNLRRQWVANRILRNRTTEILLAFHDVISRLSLDHFDISQVERAVIAAERQGVIWPGAVNASLQRLKQFDGRLIGVDRDEACSDSAALPRWFIRRIGNR